MHPSDCGPLLAFDTSTESLSAGIAWRDAQGRLQQRLHAGSGGRAASAALIPTLVALADGAGVALRDLAAVVFGCGPGSFTGLRTACSVAQGLAWGAGVPVLPVETLLAVAEDAHARSGAARVLAVLDARMGEAYAAAYARTGAGAWQRHGAIRLAKPAQVAVPDGYVVAGNLALPGHVHVAAEPGADALLRLAPVLLARGAAVAPEDALPLYIRDKVAQTTAEREAARPAPPNRAP